MGLRIRGATAVIVGNGLLGEETGRYLGQSGVRPPAARTWDLPSWTDKPDLAIVVPSRDELSLMPTFNAQALTHGLNWIQLLPFDAAAPRRRAATSAP